MALDTPLSGAFLLWFESQAYLQKLSVLPRQPAFDGSRYGREKISDRSGKGRKNVCVTHKVKLSTKLE
jgi:hypothetical protein